MNKSGWGKETLRCAALQYANGQVKECDGLNETLHSFPNVFRVSFIYLPSYYANKYTEYVYCNAPLITDQSLLKFILV